MRATRSEAIRRDTPHGSTAQLFEIVRQEAEIELVRPVQSLWWSGIAARISLSAAAMGQGLIAMHLPPDAVWAPLISSFGYCFGFLIVIMGRMQLFTENTITTVLPLLRRHDLQTLWLTTRLWMLVFVANLVGAAAVSGLWCTGG